MKGIVPALLVVFTGLVFTGCKKDEVSPAPSVIVSPQQIYVYNEVGNVQAFNVSVNSESTISKFKITRQTASEGTVTVMDTAINSNSFAYLYDYKILPDLSGKEVFFSFEATDQEGKTGKTARKLIVDNYSYSLTESSSHKMYSFNSSDYFAYDLENGVSRASGEHWELKDIQEDDLDTTNSPSFKWRGPNGSRFVRNNGFDYANATNESAKAAFESGADTYTISNLQAGDIIIVKTGHTSCCPFLVVKIQDVVDNPGRGDDYYLFSIKK